MAVVRIYRKVSDTKPIKPSASALRECRETVARRARVQRPELLDLFVPERVGKLSSFYRLPELPTSVIDNPYRRTTEHAQDGWTVPVGSLGRKGEASPSQAQSVLLWIKQNLSTVVDPSHVSVVVED